MKLNIRNVDMQVPFTDARPFCRQLQMPRGWVVQCVVGTGERRKVCSLDLYFSNVRTFSLFDPIHFFRVICLFGRSQIFGVRDE